ncbi:uncharacterized protein MELLADRAFT_61421 [Melampsora larici-populina 98AG31]|uniref:Secreted protein n=1 Tax=Melampsora larici-populina (strain 98AG31 / pathotype 3-4-7) TaxID=747676 RepID=F4REU6_MELLP|nr:uncharacterized protein MELLADRAFT_61421 [Melampsora larici-populina 98AG31]EGG09165.1 secreted protein [Melampsora larici-populina 98AG31]
MTRIFGLSTITVLAIFFVASPFLTQAFRWGNYYQFEHALIGQGKGENFLGRDPVKEFERFSWNKDEIEETVGRFFTSFDEKNIDDLVSQIHDYSNAQFFIFQHHLMGTQIAGLMEDVLHTKGNTYDTTINTVRCWTPSAKVAKLGVHGKMTLKEDGNSRQVPLNVLMTLAKDQNIIKVSGLRTVQEITVER